MPRRRKRVLLKDKREKRFPKKKVFVFFFCLILFSLFLFTRKGLWKSSDKLPVVINSQDGNVLISVIDPKRGEITNLTIPGDTQVEVARNLGARRLKNVWQLGIDEGLEGRLLAETVTKHFKFPVYAWADYPAETFSNKNLVKIVQATFSFYRTNLTIGDRLRLAFTVLRIKSFDIYDIDLKEVGYLHQARLVDGDMGYIVYGQTPQKLLSLFSDKEISENQTNIKIVNYTGNHAAAQQLGETIEVLGAKVVAVEERSDGQPDCRIVGSQKRIVEKLSNLFACKEISLSEDEGYNITFEIGEDFINRF